MRTRNVLILAAAIFMAPIAALGNYAYRDGNGTVQQIVSFVCQGIAICPAQVLIDSTGAEKATQANPLRVDPTGTTTQPVNCVSGCSSGGGGNVGGLAANGAVPSGNPIWFAGWDATDLRAILTDSSGRLILGASQNGIGNVGGKTVEVCVTPTITTSNAYGTNYVVGGVLSFANPFTSTGTGVLQSIVVDIRKVETSGFTIVPFISTPSNTGLVDANAANISSGDMFKVRGPISLNANSQLGTMTTLSADAIAKAFAPGSPSFSMVLLANAALTNQFAAGDVEVCATVLSDL